MRRPRRLLPALIAPVCAAALAPAASAAVPGWTDYDRPAKFETVTKTNVPIWMADGVKLRANITRPVTDDPVPVLITQTPYNKDAGIGAFLGGTSNYFAARGYATVIVDVRGTGSSEGDWDSFGPQEQADGRRVVQWARKRGFSNGKVGLWGPSYMAITQLYTAALQPKGLKAIFPVVPMADGYRDIAYSGGQINVSFIPLWLGLVTAGSLTPTLASNPANPAGALSSSIDALLSHLSGAASFQVPAVLDSAVGGSTAYDGPFWKTRSPLEVLDRIEVPTFVTGGLQDLFQRGEPLIYERLKDRVPTRLLMGPWTHVSGASGAGLEENGMPSLNRIALRWFDRWLLGKRRATKIGRIPNATQWVYGRERYETFADWPPPRLDPERRYLRGGGELSAEPPKAGEEAQGFLQQPVSGVCTQSTVQWTAGLGGAIPCTTDNRLDELGGAVYTSPPLKRPLDLVGPFMANLWVTSTASDAVVTVRVADVAPDGTSSELTTGWLAASFRELDRTRSRYVDGTLLQPWHPFTRSSFVPLESGVPTKMQVEIFPTAASIQPGHSVRISVNPADFPHQLPPLPQFLDSVGGQVEILTEPGHASFVELPGLGDCARPGCRSLEVPDLTRD
jgi:hypothetical protein